jgi:Transposase DDE domain
MTEKIESIPDYLVGLVELLRRRLRDASFIDRHRVRCQDFTRQRCLTFPVVMLLVLQKTVKSIQCHLHEFLAQLAADADWESVTPGAWTQARAKLRASAFVELNDECVLPLIYAPEQASQLQHWRGHRLLGLDSSLLRLPHRPDLAQAFRVVEVENHHGALGLRYCEGRLSVLYDLLNRVGLEGQLVSGLTGEVSLAASQLARLAPEDVVLLDAGFTGYRFLAQIRQRQAHFVARCSRGSFVAAQELFRQDRAGKSKLVELWAPPDQKAGVRALGLPPHMVVRFISVRLPDGKLEVLATSLLEPELYPTGEFGDLYHRRWNHETYHLFLKSRLDLENWSGHTLEAIQQDFAAAVLLCNLEGLLSRPAAAALDRQSTHTQNPQQINRAVSYHALKEQLIELLQGPTPAAEVIAHLQQLFAGNPVSLRPKRKVKRRKRSSSWSYHFQKCVRKIVF